MIKSIALVLLLAAGAADASPDSSYITLADLGKNDSPLNREAMQIALEVVAQYTELCQGHVHMLDNTGQMFEFSGNHVVASLPESGEGYYFEAEQLNGYEHYAKIYLDVGRSYRKVPDGQWNPLNSSVDFELSKFKGDWRATFPMFSFGNGLSTMVPEFGCSGKSDNVISPQKEQAELNKACQSQIFKTTALEELGKYGMVKDAGGIESLSSVAGVYVPPENLIPPEKVCKLTVTYGNGRTEEIDAHIWGSYDNPSVTVTMF